MYVTRTPTFHFLWYSSKYFLLYPKYNTADDLTDVLITIKNIVDRTTAMIDKLFEKYNEDEIKAIILVGGTSSTPFIPETLRENIKI